MNTFLWTENVPRDMIRRHPIYKGVIFIMSGVVIQKYNDLKNPSTLELIIYFIL
jgi:hypothetical protein